ncbi:proliferating cell nuclear antigen [Indivirus ILV1]|uniref:Proliferating cell nuclear antigen n=1 Tax=Indivirus ILV1 TaxID=1977633 RepID=A0A1V0SCJ8_9VIRU|nr:proliferating cell nuclear antigen [Indivirus ILV1]
MRILDVETEHTGPFKILFEVLKDMLNDVNIEFRSDGKNKSKDTEDEKETKDSKDSKDQKDQDTNCMKINAIDSTKTVLVNIKLNFDKFVCKKSKLLLGVNLGCFYKLIKSMGKNSILTLSQDHDNKNYLQIKIDSPEERKETIHNLKLIDLDEHKMAIPQITFDAVITMNSGEFNRLCRDMSNIADYMEIKCLTDKIIFTCVGEFANSNTTYRTRSDNDDDDNENIYVSINHASTKSSGKGSDTTPKIVQGIFELKHLVLFSKCASLSNDIEIYMKNDFPLVIKYQVATLGRILLCLTPIKEDTTKNTNYSDEDEFYSEDE